MIERDIHWMWHAIMLAEKAAAADEVPVGAVLVLNDEVIGEGFNRSISHCDPTSHAEIMALRNGAEKIGNYRLIDTTLYVTLEPCLMCAGAMVHARIKRLIYGAYDSKAGVVVTQAGVLDKPFLNHKITHAGGVLAEECGQMLTNFFRKKRGSLE